MKRRLSRIVMLLALSLLIVLTLPEDVQAAELTPLSDFSYRTENDAVILTKYTGADSVVTVPDSYSIDGTSYIVVLDAATVFRGSSVTSVTLLSGVDFYNNSASKLFAQCTKLTYADINAPDTSDIVDMSNLFYGCTALQTVDLSGVETGAVKMMYGMFSNCTTLTQISGLESWDTGSLLNMYQMFNYTQKLSRVDLRSWDLDQVNNTGWCFQYCYATEILLPDNLAVMSAGFFNHASKVAGTSFTIPKGVKQIGYGHTFYDFGTDAMKEYCVPAENTSFKAVDGILYSADGTKLLAIPRGKNISSFTVPEGVTFMGELSFTRNAYLTSVTLPNSFVLKYIPESDPSYILHQDVGNLNAGLNLNIAIYKFTNIGSYAVHADNPNYASCDGILYSKDMKSVAAIPTNYKRLISIPAGVTDWNENSMWAWEEGDSYMASCPGVRIPASCVRIAQDQIDKLNRLQKKYENFVITIDENNPAYYVNAAGALTPKQTVDIQMTQLDLRLQDLLKLGFHFTVNTDAQIDEVGALLWRAEDYEKETVFNINSTLAQKVTNLTGKNGAYIAESEGIYAQDLDRVYYFIAYVKTPQGYAYGKCVSGSAVIYAKTVYEMTDPAWDDTKSLVIDLLNYATAAQTYFHLADGTPAGEPINAFLSEADKTVTFSDSLKCGYATAQETTGAFAPAFRALHGSLLDAIGLNFTFNGTDVQALYYWSAAAYENTAIHDITTATGTLALTSQNDTVTGALGGIYAYRIYENFYVRACDAQGNLSKTYATSVASYISQLLDTYEPKTDAQSRALVALCKAMLVYGYNASTNPEINR